jgi:hypothetical protein
MDVLKDPSNNTIPGDSGKKKTKKYVNPILPDGTVKKGRPRKNPDAPVRQRGTKRKQVEEVGPGADSEAPPAKKHRGRPPKARADGESTTVSRVLSTEEPSIIPAKNRRGRRAKEEGVTQVSAENSTAVTADGSVLPANSVQAPMSAANIPTISTTPKKRRGPAKKVANEDDLASEDCPPTKKRRGRQLKAISNEPTIPAQPPDMSTAQVSVEPVSAMIDATAAKAVAEAGDIVSFDHDASVVSPSKALLGDMHPSSSPFTLVDDSAPPAPESILLPPAAKNSNSVETSFSGNLALSSPEEQRGFETLTALSDNSLVVQIEEAPSTPVEANTTSVDPALVVHVDGTMDAPAALVCDHQMYATLY